MDEEGLIDAHYLLYNAKKAEKSCRAKETN